MADAYKPLPLTLAQIDRRIDLFRTELEIAEQLRNDVGKKLYREMLDALATARAGLADSERREQALRNVLAEVRRQARAGEEYSFSTESSFFGPGVRKHITSRRGDLCDVRDAVERIVRRVLPADEFRGAAGDTAPQSPAQRGAPSDG